MTNRLFDQVGGIVSISLRGNNPERVINMALTRGLYIWDIKKSGEVMLLKVRESGFEAIKNIAAENGLELQVLDKQGLPFFKGRIRRRLGFLGGAVIFVLALYFMSSFIWYVDLQGNKTVEEKRILLTAAKYGVYKGAAKWSFSRIEVEEAILREIPELSYIKIDIRGVKARIEVVEKILPQKEITGPCHIVASRDGVIEEMLVLEGQPRVKEGDVVGKGTILISGVVFPTEVQNQVPFKEDTHPSITPEPYLVRARGIVKARVWYEGYGECKLRSESKVLTGKEDRKIIVNTPWQDFVIRDYKEPGFTLAQETRIKNHLSTYLGIFGWETVIIQEEKEKVVEYSQDEAARIAEKRAMEKLSQVIGSREKLPEEIKVEVLSSPSDPVLRIKVFVEVIEDIAWAEPINIPGNSN
ncbi:MAG: sporulation protein YqfD [Syntrophomonadaceae bacterium]|jgi:similar to stage IV sporulation protein